MTRSLVFATPVFPSFQGNGLAMRAAATLRLLSQWARVHLLVIPIYHAGADAPSPEVAQLCQSWRAVANPDWSICEDPSKEWLDIAGGADCLPREWRWCNSLWQSEIKKALGELNPDLVLVFRFYLAPYILPGVQSGTTAWLDIDELESSSRARLSHIYSIGGKKERACETGMEVPAYERLESHYLKSFERIFACSKKEAEGVLARCPEASVCVLPNTYPDARPHPPREADGKARFLFVGSLGYYPNQDAVGYFARKILPIIKTRSPFPVEVTVIGGGWKSELASEDPSISDISFVGAVPDTTPFYATCDAVIVPLRSAGGTRIKILEAFSHARPVVSTNIGAEGLECVNGLHLDIADSPEDFAGQCLRLIADSERRLKLATNGHELFKQEYAMPRLEAKMAHLFAD